MAPVAPNVAGPGQAEIILEVEEVQANGDRYDEPVYHERNHGCCVVM